jgi:hypothetical protein
MGIRRKQEKEVWTDRQTVIKRQICGEGERQIERWRESEIDLQRDGEMERWRDDEKTERDDER